MNRSASPKCIFLAGCGNMGNALLTRWRTSPHCANARFVTLDPKQAPHSTDHYASLDAVPNDVKPDVIVLAVKPQSLPELLPAYRTRFGHSPLYLSIAAGKTLSFFAEKLGANARIIRAMPNTPAMIGKGMSVLCANKLADTNDKTTAETLLAAVGHIAWLEDETLMDAVTALSGSGPAYVFLFLDALTKAGISAGLPEPLARILALHTVRGSASLAAASGDSFAQLRQNVTSPGGTTEAALAVLMRETGLEKLMGDAVAEAKRRSRELSGN